VGALNVWTNRFPPRAVTLLGMAARPREITSRRLYHDAVQKLFSKLTRGTLKNTDNISDD